MANSATPSNGYLNNSAPEEDVGSGPHDSPPAEVPNSIDLLVNKNKNISRFPVFSATQSNCFPHLFMHQNYRNDENDVQTVIFDLRNRLIERNFTAPMAAFEFVFEKFPHVRVAYKNLRCFPVEKKTRNAILINGSKQHALLKKSTLESYEKFPMKFNLPRNKTAKFPMTLQSCPKFCDDRIKIDLMDPDAYSKLARLRSLGAPPAKCFPHKTFPIKRINYKQLKTFPNNMLYEIFRSPKDARKFPLHLLRQIDSEFPVAHTPRGPEFRALHAIGKNGVMSFNKSIKQPLMPQNKKSRCKKSFPLQKTGRFNLQKFPVRHESDLVLTKHISGLKSNISNNDGVPLTATATAMTHFEAQINTSLRTDISTNTQVAPSGSNFGGAEHQRSHQQVEAALKFLNDALLSAINSINTGQQQYESNQIEQANLLVFEQNINNEQDQPEQPQLLPNLTTIPAPPLPVYLENLSHSVAFDVPQPHRSNDGVHRAHQSAHNSVCNHRLAQSQPYSDVRGTSSQAVRPAAATCPARDIPPSLSEIALASLTDTVESRIRSHLEILPSYYKSHAPVLEAERSATDEWKAVINTADSNFDSTRIAVNETPFSTREALEMTIARVEDSEPDHEYLSHSNQHKFVDDTPTPCADEMKFEMKNVKGALPSTHARTTTSTNLPLKTDSTTARWSTSLATQNDPTNNARWSASNAPQPQTYRRSSTSGLDLHAPGAAHAPNSNRPASGEQRLQRPELALRTEHEVGRSVSVDTLGSVLPTRTRLRRQRRMLSQQNSEEQPEDAIERLNRLRARISGALSEVKGVLQKYSTDVEGEGDAEQFPAPLRKPATARSTDSSVQTTPPPKEEPAPVQFRFVRKVRRRSIFNEDEEDNLKTAESEGERKNEANQAEDKSEAIEFDKNKASKQENIEHKKTEPSSLDATKFGENPLQKQKNEASIAETVEAQHNKNEAKQTGDEKDAAKQPKNETRQAEDKSDNELRIAEECASAKIEAKLQEIQIAALPYDSNSALKRDAGGDRITDTVKPLAIVPGEAARTSESQTGTALSSKRHSMEVSTKPNELPAETSNNLKESCIERARERSVESAVNLKKTSVSPKELSLEPPNNQNDSSAGPLVRPRKPSLDIPKITEQKPPAEILEAQSATSPMELSSEISNNQKESSSVTPVSLAQQSAANTQKEPSAQTEVNPKEATGPSPSNQKPATPKIKKRMIIKVKDPGRRASIAAVEQSKIEPPLKTLAVQSIKSQRRPSDSEAILRKKPLRIDEVDEGAISPKIKVITKVRRTSLKGKLSQAQENDSKAASKAQQTSDTNNSAKDALPNASMTVVSTTPASAVPVPTQSVIDDAPLTNSEAATTAASTCEATKDSSAATKPNEQSAAAMVATLVSTVRSTEQNGLTTCELLRQDNQAAAGEIQKNTIPPASAEIKKPISQEILAADTYDNTEAARTPQQVASALAAPEAIAPSGGAATKANIAPTAPDSSATPAASATSAPTPAHTSQAPPQATMPELQVAHLPVQPVPASMGAPFNVPKEDFGKKKVVIKKIIRKISIDKAKKSEDKSATDETDKSLALSEEQDIPIEPVLVEEIAAPVKKPRKVKRKVIIKRQQRRLSISDTFFNGPDDSAEQPATEVETLEKAIAYETDEEEDSKKEDAEPPEPPKPLKSCLRLREYEIGDWVMYAERYKKTQVRWKKGRVIERITSISYKLDIDGKEVPAHISYIKKYNERKVSFSGKEYLEIDYEQIAQEEEKARTYSIWNMV